MGRWAAQTSRVRVSARSQLFPPLYPHFNRPSGFWPCQVLSGGSQRQILICIALFCQGNLLVFPTRYNTFFLIQYILSVFIYLYIRKLHCISSSSWPATIPFSNFHSISTLNFDLSYVVGWLKSFSNILLRANFWCVNEDVKFLGSMVVVGPLTSCALLHSVFVL